MDLTTSYLIYAIAAIGLTGVLARTLFRNGQVFLRDVFPDNEGMAEDIVLALQDEGDLMEADRLAGVMLEAAAAVAAE